jgi:hypothetical protein
MADSGPEGLTQPRDEVSRQQGKSQLNGKHEQGATDENSERDEDGNGGNTNDEDDVEDTSSSGSEDSEQEETSSDDDDDDDDDNVDGGNDALLSLLLRPEGSTTGTTISNPSGGPETSIPKPIPTPAAGPGGSSDLGSRLKDFLPQLQRANDELKPSDDKQRIDLVDDNAEHYIEMNLGLGVLSEQPTKEDEVKLGFESSTEDDDSDDDQDGNDENTNKHGNQPPSKEASNEDVMARLKGETSRKGKRKIEELG